MSIDIETPLSPTRYLSEFAKGAANSLFGLGIICIPMLLFGFFLGGELGLLTYLSFSGLVFYIALHRITGDTTTLKEETNSTILQIIGALLLIVYYNSVLFVATVLSGGVAIEGLPAVGVMIAVTYPIYDLEIARLYAPFSIAGAFVFTLAIMAEIILFIESTMGWFKGQDLLRSLGSLKDSNESVLFALIGGVEAVLDQLRIGNLRKSAPR